MKWDKLSTPSNIQSCWDVGVSESEGNWSSFVIKQMNMLSVKIDVEVTVCIGCKYMQKCRN